ILDNKLIKNIRVGLSVISLTKTSDDATAIPNPINGIAQFLNIGKIMNLFFKIMCISVFYKDNNLKQMEKDSCKPSMRIPFLNNCFALILFHPKFVIRNFNS